MTIETVLCPCTKITDRARKKDERKNKLSQEEALAKKFLLKISSRRNGG